VRPIHDPAGISGVTSRGVLSWEPEGPYLPNNLFVTQLPTAPAKLRRANIIPYPQRTTRAVSFHRLFPGVT
jgi:hypothetical protein